MSIIHFLTSLGPEDHELGECQDYRGSGVALWQLFCRMTMMMLLTRILSASRMKQLEMRAMKRMKILLPTRMMEAPLLMIQGKENLMAVTVERRKRCRSKRNSRKSILSRHGRLGKKRKMATN